MRFLPPSGTPHNLAGLGYTDHTWDAPAHEARGQRTSSERMPSVVLEATGRPQPVTYGERRDVESLMLHDALTDRALPFLDFVNRRLFSDALLIAHRGEIVYERYFNGMTEDDVHLCHSCTKTLTTMQIGIAIDEQRLATDQLVRELLPELQGIAAWDGVTLQNLLDMSTGIETEEHYEDANSMYYDYARAVGYWGPAGGDGALDFVLRRLVNPSVEPGSLFNYASYNTNLLPLILERAYGQSAAEIYERDLFRKIGAEHDALINVDAQGNMIVEGQLNLTLRDFYRWGHLLTTGGLNLAGERVVPQAWVDASFAWDQGRANAFARSEYADFLPEGSYRNQIWRPDARNGIAVMLGIYGQFFYIDRPRQIEIVGFGSYPEFTSPLMATQLQTLWGSVTVDLERAP